MVMIVLLGLLVVILLGSEAEFIVRRKFSVFSTVTSFIMETSKCAWVCPAGITTLYGPEA